MPLLASGAAPTRTVSMDGVLRIPLGKRLHQGYGLIDAVDWNRSFTVVVAGVTITTSPMNHNWRLSRSTKWQYVCTTYIDRSGPKKRHLMLFLHRLITECPPDLIPDHCNHDGLDNRRCNLQLVSESVNLSRERRRYGWEHRAVTYSQSRGVWLAKIRFEGKHRQASFASEGEAREWYAGLYEAQARKRLNPEPSHA